MKRWLGIIAFSVLASSCTESPGPVAAPLNIPTSPSYVSLGAGPPQTGSGTGSITSLEEVSTRDAGRNVIKERRLTGTLSGTLEGSFVEEVRGVIHDGRVTFHGTLEVTGSVLGCGEGTFVLGLTGEGSAGVSPVTDAQVRVIHHASNTLPVAGTGTVHQEGPSLTYDIKYTCK